MKHLYAFKYLFKLLFVFSPIDLKCSASAQLSANIKNVHRYSKRQNYGNVLRSTKTKKSERKNHYTKNFVELSFLLFEKNGTAISSHPVFVWFVDKVK